MHIGKNLLQLFIGVVMASGWSSAQAADYPTKPITLIIPCAAGAPTDTVGRLIGRAMEEYLRRALIISRGDPMVFLTRPISAAMLALAVITLVIVLRPAVRKKREEAFQED